MHCWSNEVSNQSLMFDLGGTGSFQYQHLTITTTILSKLYVKTAKIVIYSTIQKIKSEIFIGEDFIKLKSLQFITTSLIKD